MCKKQSITQKQFMQSIELILIQQGRMFAKAGLKNPWEAVVSEPLPSRKSSSSSQDTDDKKVGFSDEMETYVFEKWVIKNNKHNRIGSLDDRKGSSDYHKMYTYTPKFNNRSADLDSLFGSRRAQEAFYEDEADAFLTHGNVVVAELSAKDEFLAVKKLRKLLLNFGDVLNFSFDKWREVYIMLYQYGGTEKFVPGMRQSKKVIETDGAEKSDSEQSESVVKVSNGGFVLETHGRQYILRVPYDFRTKHLLEFAGREVPAAQMIL